jgi:predicted Zn-dependent protease
MRSQADALALAERILSLASGADQAEVTVSIDDSAYSRFAGNYVPENLDGAQTDIQLTYVKDQRLGSASTNDVSDAGMRRLVASAADIASRVPANHEFVSLAVKAPIAQPGKSVYASTLNATPDDRIDKLLPVFTRMRQSQLSSSGFTTTQHSVYAVVNSLGVRAAFESTYSGIEIKAMAPQTSGFAEYFSRDYATLNSLERADLAASKATVSLTPADFPPGTYTVILEPPAFVDCLNNVYAAMNAGGVLENQNSWMAGRIGKPLFSSNVTAVDDWSNPLVAGQPFASDGAPTQKVTLIEAGIPKAYVSSTYLANKYKIPNTGHDGYPTNAVLSPGTQTREQLIASVERGILVSRTWYTRMVDPREVVITGLTRDGVYLIENGKLTTTLKNFRFYTSMLTALADCEFGNTLYLAESADTPGTLAVPVAKIAKFAFSAQTSFA